MFADGLVLPRALKVLEAGVLVGEPPNLWLMRDTNGDNTADTRTLVTDTYGRRDANVEHNANGLMWALDNWIYTSEVDMFLRLKNGSSRYGRRYLAGNGASPRTMRDGFFATPIRRCSTWTSCRRSTTPGPPASSEHAAATSRSRILKTI